MKDLTLAFTIIIKGCIANKMTPEQMASQLNEHVQHEVKNLNIPAVSVNEVKVCPICGVPFYYLYNKDYYQQECECDLSGQT